MSSTPQHDADHALAYPEPPASHPWRHHGTKARPLTDAQRKRNCELLLLAQRQHRVEEPTCSPT
ncbi:MULTISPECIES: hypothetical protein [unclassified Streptomyces]|uniref:hypothetical protein n=1 Tax=unclassified Streptomyces TaxID=2593676 RepID=UPI002E22E5F2|nr:hypothetical protein OG760_37745 [Streptomyces sp. NBC_00963]